MELSDFKLHKLDVNVQIANFDCGDEDLNDFITNDAIHYSTKLLAVTYLLVHEGNIAAFLVCLTTKYQ